MKTVSILRNALTCIILCTLLLAAACSSKPQAEDTPAPPEAIQPEESAPKQEMKLDYKASLTGLPLEKPATERPIAVMINNMAKARPQSGLTHADIVYEVLAEGGITRLVAIFQSDSFQEPIGPIRSIRPYLIEIGESFQGVLVHAGASNDGYYILQRQRKEHLDEISNAGAYFWRDKSRKAPHNLYSNLEKLRKGAEQKKYKQNVQIPSFPFVSDETAVPVGEDISKITVQFLLKNYKVTYTYDPVTKLYNRFINDKPHIDLNNNQQLTATNVVVLGANHKTLDNVGRLYVNLTKGGEAVLYQRGKAIRCTWERKSADDVIRLYKDGQELPLYPGKTYFNIVPNDPTFDKHIQAE